MLTPPHTPHALPHALVDTDAIFTHEVSLCFVARGDYEVALCCVSADVVWWCAEPLQIRAEET